MKRYVFNDEVAARPTGVTNIRWRSTMKPRVATGSQKESLEGRQPQKPVRKSNAMVQYYCMQTQVLQ